MVVVVERRAADSPRRVQQSTFAVGTDIAGTDTRDLRKLIEAVLSQRSAPRSRPRRGFAVHRDTSCDHCSRESKFASEDNFYPWLFASDSMHAAPSAHMCIARDARPP